MFRRLFFIVIIINIHTSLCSLELYEAGRQVWKLYTMIDNRGLNISRNTEATEYLSHDSTIRALEKQKNKIHENLREVEQFMGPKKIKNAFILWQFNAWIIRNIDNIEIFVQLIDEYFERFHGYRNGKYGSNVSFESVRSEILQELPDKIEALRKFAYEDAQKNTYEDVIAAIAGFARDNVKEIATNAAMNACLFQSRSAEICGTPQIISDILMKLLKMLIIAELKTSTMLAYQDMYDCIMYNKDQQECQRTNSLARQIFEKQLAIYINIFSSNIAVVDGLYQRACDPRFGNWIRDESFYELEKTVEPSLFSYNAYKCQLDTCHNMMFRDANRCQITLYDKPSGPRPNYAVDECAFLGRIEACLLNSGPYRYQYVKSTELDFLGRNSSCPEDNSQVINPMPIGNYAACECNVWSSQNSISLLAVTSNVSSNRVIIGLSFVRRNKVLSIQIREGELGPNGYITESSRSWKHTSVTWESRATEPINKENRVFFLDDLILPSGFVLTGVKFNKVTRENVTGFGLEIFGRPFDYKTGKLKSNDGWRWWQGSNKVSGTPLSFTSVSSIFTTLPHTVTSSDIKYVSLEPSRLKEDFGQSTLPLFDGVPIEFSVPSPLTGVGMFHKGAEGYAGLISLRVYGMKYLEDFNNFKLSHMINDRVSFNSSEI